jgi:hypothetical protein
MNIGEIRSTPNPYHQKHQTPRTAASPESVRRNDPPAPADEAAETEGVFSQAETKYFEGLFPQSAKEIRSYATYRREGNASPAVLGSLIDRKG